jgi:hypothetical protein
MAKKDDVIRSQNGNSRRNRYFPFVYRMQRVEKYLSDEYFEGSQHGANRLDPCREQILSKIEIDIIVTN